MNLADQKFWIFDMDGTLTVAAHDFDAIRKTLGLKPKQPILEQLAQLPGEQAVPLLQQLDVIELDIARRALPQPGARELLSRLCGRGATCGILTRNSHRSALVTLSTCGLDEFFDPRFILGRESCVPKPSPDGIRRLLREWGAAPYEAVLVGDYLFDLRSGREAGVFTVYVDPSGEFEWSDHADTSVCGLKDLLHLINENV